MEHIVISPEMVVLMGEGEVPSLELPDKAVAFLMDYGAVGTPASLHMIDDASLSPVKEGGHNRLILFVARAACKRIADGAFGLAEGAYYLPADLRAIAIAIRDCDHSEAAALPYRVAKAIELLCEIVRACRADAFVPIGQDTGLSRADGQRLLQARRMIDDRWAEKLTLDMIARACGLNRAKLTRGFRDMFASTVADAITDRRLCKAGEMLVATDLPVSSIGYRCGYLNNTSFTRAFARRFGVAPTQYRMHRLAA